MSLVNKFENIRKTLSWLNRKRKGAQRKLPIRLAMPLFRRHPQRPTVIKRVLFVHTSGGTGDALYVLGLVRRLASHGVVSSIGTLEKHLSIFSRSGQFREVFPLDGAPCNLSDFDMVIDLEYVNHNHWKLRIPVLKQMHCWRITTGPEMSRLPLYDEYIDYSKRRHISDRFALVCERILNESISPRVMPFVPTDKKAEEEAEAFLCSLAGYRRIVYLNTQAGDADRCFSKEQTIAMLKMLVKLPETVVVILPPTVEDSKDFLISPNVTLLPRFSFLAFGVFVRHCVWTITPDTSVTHVAACFDKPCLTFFPPNDRDYFIQYGAWETWGALSTISETVHPDAEDLTIDRYGTSNHRTLCASDISTSVLESEIRKFAKRLGFDL